MIFFVKAIDKTMYDDVVQRLQKEVEVVGQVKQAADFDPEVLLPNLHNVLNLFDIDNIR